MSKYNAQSEIHRTHVESIFDDAIEYCNYNQIYDMQFDECAILRAKTILNDKHESLANIALIVHENDFVVEVTTPYYQCYMTLLDINADILSFLIRNATKCIDDHDESQQFFYSFFSNNDIYANTDMISTIIAYAVRIDVDLTFPMPIHLQHDEKTESNVA